MTWLAETAMLSFGWRRWALLLAAGALAGLSTAPLFALPALFVALPVLVWCLDGAERGARFGLVFGAPFRIGFAFGLGYFTVAFHWLGAAFFVVGGPMLAVMPFAVVALAALIALFWGLGCALAHLLWTNGAWRIVTLAASLTLAEWARGHFLSGFPFDLLGYALTATPEMMQSAALVGVYGLTFLAALIGATPALIWPADGRTVARRLFPFFAAMLVVAAQIGWGQYRLSTTEIVARDDGLRMRLVQPVLYEHADWGRVDPPSVIDRLIMLSEMRTSPADPGLEGVTHLVWPESSIPFYLSDYPDALARISRMLPAGTLLLAGAPREDFAALAGADGPAPVYNSILAIDAGGEIVASYDKSHLVPFGEYLPFPYVFAALGISQFVPGAQGWQEGDGRRLMQLRGTPPLLALICYEILFSGDLGETGAAGFLFNITNDAWFDGSIGPAKHAHHARIRAVEEGMALVRGANSGLTFVTDPLGRITAQLAPMEMGVLDAAPAVRLESTPFARWRHWPLLAVLVATLGASLLLARRPRRK